jgi:hypothetical protein
MGVHVPEGPACPVPHTARLLIAVKVQITRKSAAASASAAASVANATGAAPSRMSAPTPPCGETHQKTRKSPGVSARPVDSVAISTAPPAALPLAS